MTKVWHWAQSDKIELIKESGKILLEGSNNERFVKADNAPMELKRLWANMLSQYKAVGRYVWLTEENRYAPKSFKPQDKIGFLFDAKEINAKKWHYVQRDLKKTNNADAMTHISQLNRSAQKVNGDDPYKWWCVDKEISLDLCKGIYVWDDNKSAYVIESE